MPDTRLHFRGGNAPASLKRFTEYALAEIYGAHFRGGNAPASLKPLQQIRRETQARYFRGGNAPASLKLDDAAVGRLVSRDFRGGNAPASLKLAVRRPSNREGHAPFPGWQRPGLIEARLPLQDLHCWMPPFPGWQRPGLIEAWWKPALRGERTEAAGRPYIAISHISGEAPPLPH